MATIAIIWLLSNLLCLYIVRKRGIEVGFLLRLLAVVIGPIAIPLSFLGNPKPTA